MRVLSIDPGCEESAWVIFDTDTFMPMDFAKQNNEDVLHLVANPGGRFDVLVIERIAAMGMAVGEEVFETVFWSGRLAQAWGGEFHCVKRHQVKMHLCQNMRAKDPNIRQALIDRYGGKAKGIGSKASPGPLFGIAADVWAALSVVITWAETADVLQV